MEGGRGVERSNHGGGRYRDGGSGEGREGGNGRYRRAVRHRVEWNYEGYIIILELRVNKIHYLTSVPSRKGIHWPSYREYNSKREDNYSNCAKGSDTLNC